MPVKNKNSGEVHKGQKGGTTGCGFDTTDNPNNWVIASGKITCGRGGCSS